MSASNVQCQIGPMRRGKPISDTMPKRGKVTEMCKEWLVHEDGALAYQLQQEEVEKHYSNNKSRNAIVREDFPMAVDAQRRAEDEAMAEYHMQTKLLEEKDARIAREIAEKLEREENERKRWLEVEDQRMARIIDERDKRTKIPISRHGDINAVGLPLPAAVREAPFPGSAYPLPSRSSTSPVGACGGEAKYENISQLRARRTMFEVEEQFRRMQLPQEETDNLSWPLPPDPEQLSKEDQERRDEELAKRLQLEEQSEELDLVDRDRMLAIEVQDLELAKMLQEKERARLRRAKEKARAKALAKRQLEESVCQPYSVEEIAPAETATVMNIATAIDPTYVPPKPGSTSLQQSPSCSAHSTLSHSGSSVGGALRHSPCYFPSDNILLDNAPDDTPPYMPVQGQRRTSSMEKKKKKSKDGDCKQQ